jgi:putative molybdopterin biosynthesis protein
MSEQRFYTIEEVAKLLRVNERTVRKLIDSGELHATRVGRQYRISQEQLDDYLRRHT